MPPPSHAGSSTRHEAVLVALICALGAFRVFLLSAAFPLFDNVDEVVHFDAVVRYARSGLPDRCDEPFQHDTPEIVATYHSPEFILDPSVPGNRIDPPSWRISPAERAQRLQGVEGAMHGWTNLESCSPPVYYLAAGAWYRLGQGLGLGGGALIYWIRFLNVAGIVALALLGHRFVARFFPGEEFLRLAVPLLIAFFPQDTFFSINSDAASPVTFGLCFFLVVACCLEEHGPFYLLLAGLAVSAAALSKLSNVGILLLAPALVLPALRNGVRKEFLLKSAAFISGAVVPVVLWIVRNQLVLHDPLGVAWKTRALGWTVLPFSRRFANPIFTPSGAFDFLTTTIRTFWTGEFLWHGKGMSPALLDFAYVASTLVFVAVAAAGVARGGRSRRLVLGSACACLALFLGFYVWASIRHDYGACPNPSRAIPYFRSGRLMLGALLPFAILYLVGLRAIAGRSGRLALAMTIAIVTVVTTVEIVGAVPVFRSAYNWFHLP